MPQPPVYICAAKRTAVGSFGGALAQVAAPQLGATVIRAVLTESGVPKEAVDEVIMGCILTAGVGQAPARQAALFAELPKSVQALTINKVCSSGLKAVMLAMDGIQAGRINCVVAGGMENMSRAPYLLPSMRTGARLGHTEAKDSLILDALWDVYNDFHMGNAGELCARKFEFSREQQDAYTTESYRRALAAIEAGIFDAEIAPVLIPSKKGDTVFRVDEEPGKADLSKIASLKPVFDKNGTITAANASSLNDGAAALLICSEQAVQAHGLKPLARILAQGWNGQEPEWFTTAPVGAILRALESAGLQLDQVDLFEINEAFAAVAMACSRELGIDTAKVNVNGGAVALGHPLGASGAKILTTLVHTLKRTGKKTGAVGICNGGGEATALIVETC